MADEPRENPQKEREEKSEWLEAIRIAVKEAFQENKPQEEPEEVEEVPVPPAPPAPQEEETPEIPEVPAPEVKPESKWKKAVKFLF